MIGRCFVAALALGTVVAGGATAASIGDTPFAAVYEMSAAPDPTGDLTSMGGVQSIEWSPDCEGGTLVQHLVLRAEINAGPTVDTSIRFSAWESLDASRFRFFFSLSDSLGKEEKIEGLAVREDGKITVEYKTPEAETKSLPGDVMFPWQHLRAIQEAARDGKKSVSFSVLRGEKPEKDPADVYTQIIGRVAADDDAKEVKGGADLLAGSYLRIATGVFEQPIEETPSFETAETLTDNGIIINGELKFPDLHLRMKLREVQTSPKPEC